MDELSCESCPPILLHHKGARYIHGRSTVSEGNIFPPLLFSLSHEVGVQWFNLRGTYGLAVPSYHLQLPPVELLPVFPARFASTIPPSSSLLSSSENGRELMCGCIKYGKSYTNESSAFCFSSCFTLPRSTTSQNFARVLCRDKAGFLQACAWSY